MGSSRKGNGDTRTVRDRNRAARQQALREYLQGVDLLPKILDGIQKIETADPDTLPGIKAAAELRLKLLNKVLPDLKAVEHSGEDGGPISFQAIERRIVDPSDRPKD